MLFPIVLYIIGIQIYQKVKIKDKNTRSMAMGNEISGELCSNYFQNVNSCHYLMPLPATETKINKIKPCLALYGEKLRKETFYFSAVSCKIQHFTCIVRYSIVLHIYTIPFGGAKKQMKFDFIEDFINL